MKNIVPIIEGVKMSLTGSMIDIDFNESRFGHLSDIFDELFGKEISHNYNVLQTDKQIRILAEDIQEIRNILVSGTKKFDGNMTGYQRSSLQSRLVRMKVITMIIIIINIIALYPLYQTLFIIAVPRFKMRSLPQGK